MARNYVILEYCLKKSMFILFVSLKEKKSPTQLLRTPFIKSCETVLSIFISDSLSISMFFMAYWKNSTKTKNVFMTPHKKMKFSIKDFHP